MISLINEIETEIGNTFTSVAFSELIVAGGGSEETTDPERININNSKIDTSLSVDIDEALGTTSDETQQTEQVDLSNPTLMENAITMTVNAQTNVSYFQLMNMLRFINSYKYKLNLDNINISVSESNLNVNFQLTMIGIKSQTREVETVEIEGYNLGKDSIFSPFSGYGSIFNVGTGEGTGLLRESLIDSSADLFIRLEPITADPTTVTIGRTNDGARRTYLYADKNSFENATIEFFMKDNKYFMRYKTEERSYPSNYEEGIEFDPGKALELQIFSSRRVSDDDNSGLNATLINKTNLPLRIVYFSEDTSRPRFNIVKTEGEVQR